MESCFRLISKTTAILLSVTLLCVMGCSSNVRVKSDQWEEIDSHIDRMVILSFVHKQNHRFGTWLDSYFAQHFDNIGIETEVIAITRKNIDSLNQLPSYQKDKIEDFNPLALMMVKTTGLHINKRNLADAANFDVQLYVMDPKQLVWEAKIEADSVKGIFTKEVAEVIGRKTVAQLKKDGFLPN